MDDPGELISLAQFLVELAAVGAIGLAALEFFQGQRRPRLGLLLLEIGEHSPSKHLIVDAQLSADERAGVEFSLMLDNSGVDAARWIKVKITALDVEGMASRVIAFEFSGSSDAGSWSRGPSGMTYNFTGDDSFISYSRPKEAGYLPDWLDHLGDFRVIVQAIAGSGGPVARFACSMWADSVRRQDETLTLALG